MDTFDVIFTTYSPLVFRYLRSLSGDAAVAEELTAETFYRAYTHFDSFRGDSKLETWLCAIAKNAYLKDCRRSARTVGADALETQPAETDFVEHFLDREQARQIYRHVHELGALLAVFLVFIGKTFVILGQSGSIVSAALPPVRPTSPGVRSAAPPRRSARMSLRPVRHASSSRRTRCRMRP